MSDLEDGDNNMEDHDDYGMLEIANVFGNAVNANLVSFDDMATSTCPIKEASKFYRLLQESSHELYPECISTFSTLLCIV